MKRLLVVLAAGAAALSLASCKHKPPADVAAEVNGHAITMADGTILVVKIGSTTFDNVTRAMQSLCENNVLGIVANGARASELYSKYTYYYSKAE